jgi:ABC-type transport system involved in cytochrome c biogenesis permease subunit
VIVITVLLLAAFVVLVATAVTGLALAVAVPRPVPATPSGPAVVDTGASEADAVRRSRWIVGGVVVAFGFLLTATVLRTIVVGHAPWSNLHEFSIAFAAALLGSYLGVARTAQIAGLAPIVALLAAGLVGFAIGLDDRIDPLVPALQQPLLLTVHVGAAVLAYALAGVAFAAAASEIGQRAAADRIGLLPTASDARAVGHRAVLLAFPVLTIAIVLGAAWANLAWRAPWSNDPKELAAAATWLVFGAYLHVAGRRDRWAALAPWLIVLGFVGVLFTYVGAGLFIVGEHSYGGS